MHLFEEYLNRQNISIPIVQHCATGIVILKNPDNSKLFLFIKRIESESKPSFYNIILKSPVHDGYRYNAFFKQKKVSVVTWQMYEQFFLDRNNFENTTAVCGNKNISLACLEVLAFIYDGWFCEKSSYLKNILYNCLDLDLTLEERFENYNNLINKLHKFEPNIYYNYKKNLLLPTENYAEWLAKIINK